MSNPSVLFRSLLIYGACVPVAVFLGFLLAKPLDIFTFAVVGALFLLLLSPLFLRYYHPWLLASWNMSAVLFFLPGHPQLWMGMTAIALMIAVLQFVMSREHKIISVPSITRPLIFLAVVVIVTAQATGGIGLRSFGSEVYGGKRYFMIVIAILGYFAIISRRVPPRHAYLYVAIFFLGSCTMAIGSLAGRVPAQLSFLFWVFPVESMSYMSNVSNSVMSRSWGLALLSLGIFCAMLAKYGARGILNFQRPHRLVLFLAVIFMGLLGGYRSILIIYILTFGLLLYLEGLLQTRLLPALVLTVILGGALITAFATHLPLSVQRTLAFLPIRIDPIAKLNAQASNEWRLRMWANVLPEIPQYFWLGKGYLFSGTDDFLYQFKSYEEGSSGSELVGDYHNGPLSVILPFGITGVAAFLWFMYAATKLLFRNYKYSIPEYQVLNRFIFAYWVARVIFFFAVFGGFYSDLALFTGLVGLSISLNGGVAQPEPEKALQFNFEGEAMAAAEERAPVGAV